jgi:hypothetical protein
MAEDRILVMDSVTKLASEDAGKVLVAASHGGVYAAYLAAKGKARGVILNDAGGGLESAGFGGLDWADAIGMPAATVDCMSARIGDGKDMMSTGYISFINKAAAKAGVSVGLGCGAAAARMLTADMWSSELPELPESRFVISQKTDEPMVIGCDSASLIKDEDAGQIVVCASHGGLLANNPGYILKAPVLGIVLNDAGIGKEKAGVARIYAASSMGVAAGAVMAKSARIGDARSSWDTGIISVVNDLASAFGCTVGMTTKKFVATIIHAQRNK